jgi:hypothetical protein
MLPEALLRLRGEASATGKGQRPAAVHTFLPGLSDQASRAIPQATYQNLSIKLPALAARMN